MLDILRVAENVYQWALLCGWMQHEPTRLEYKRELQQEIAYLRRMVGNR